MSQNVPPNDPNQRPAAADADGIGANPYYAQQQSPPPNLDAGAPTLQSSDLQRLNRKALFFLAGIVLLLIIAFVFILQAGSAKKDVPPKREETVSIPDLPTAPVVREPVPQVQPIPVAPMPELPPPPLPPEEPRQRAAAAQAQPRGPTLLERRMMDDSETGAQAAANPQDPYSNAFAGAQQQSAVAEAKPEPVTSARFINKPAALLVRGTYIRCILETRIITEVDGFTSCIVTEPTYSINGRNLLIPKGSKILGSYGGGVGNKRRVAVVWDRITTPTGIDIAMSSPGIDTLGGAGYEGQYSAHWGSRIASALLISLISDAFKYAAAENGPETTTVGSGGVAVQSPYESATARTMERLANQSLNSPRPPTITINQGTVLNVYVAQDVDFSSVLAQY